jgi:hypothetical protein
MPNHLLIYVIVLLNVACQIMLIWRLKLDRTIKLKYCALALAIPTVIAVTVRVLVAAGIMHVRLAEQGMLERTITTLASILLIASPFMITIAAVIFRRKQKRLAALLVQ